MRRVTIPAMMVAALMACTSVLAEEAVEVCELPEVQVTFNGYERFTEGAENGYSALYFKFRNDTDQPIEAVFVYYELRSEGRSVPWVEKYTGTRIPGGIEPSEVKAIEFWLSRQDAWPSDVGEPIIDFRLAGVHFYRGDRVSVGYCDDA